MALNDIRNIPKIDVNNARGITPEIKSLHKRMLCAGDKLCANLRPASTVGGGLEWFLYFLPYYKNLMPLLSYDQSFYLKEEFMSGDRGVKDTGTGLNCPNTIRFFEAINAMVLPEHTKDNAIL